MTLAEHHVQVDTENLTAVVDTNVLLDVFSCHDLVNEYQKLGAAAAATDPTAVYRRARARESLLLAMYFHSARAFTYSLREGLRLMLAKVDPDAHASLETHYTKVFVHFVREQLLDQWTACMPTDDGNDPKGNEADDALVAYAQLHQLPLISNEAFSPRGVVTDKIRKKAAAARVQVFTPKEFYLGKIDEAEKISSFIRRFRERSPLYVRAHHEPQIISHTIDTLDGYYRHILLGETSGLARPVAVSVS